MAAVRTSSRISPRSRAPASRPSRKTRRSSSRSRKAPRASRPSRSSRSPDFPNFQDTAAPGLPFFLLARFSHEHGGHGEKQEKHGERQNLQVSDSRYWLRRTGLKPRR